MFPNKQEDNSDMITQICKNLTYERFEIGDVIMREGDKSNNKMYYITLIIIIKVCNHTRLSFYNKKNIKKCLFFRIIESFKFR